MIAAIVLGVAAIRGISDESEIQYAALDLTVYSNSGYRFSQPLALFLGAVAVWALYCFSYRVFLYEHIVITPEDFSIRREWNRRSRLQRFVDLESQETSRVSWFSQRTLQQVSGKTRNLEGTQVRL